MECIILYRNPSSGKVGALTELDEADDVAVFPDRDAAIALADRHFICRSWPYQIVELDEL